MHSFTQEENEIGFFSKAAPFGHGSDRKTDGLIASGFTTAANGDNGLYQERWKRFIQCGIKGDLYLAYLHERSEWNLCIRD